jgi:hypothetical protein
MEAIGIKTVIPAKLYTKNKKRINAFQIPFSFSSGINNSIISLVQKQSWTSFLSVSFLCSKIEHVKRFKLNAEKFGYIRTQQLFNYVLYYKSFI